VIGAARTHLQALEGAARIEKPSTAQLPLFTTTVESAAAKLIDGVDPDALSPREALDALYRLKAAREAEKKK
jgi:DNA mismatch repair protein MutS